MAERDFPDGRMQKMMGKSWSSWNLPEQPTEFDLRKLRDSFQQPEQQQSIPLIGKFLLLFGTHPDSDYLSITKCPACGWLLKIQHANRHFLRDSRGAVVCRDSDLAIFGSKVLGKSLHPLGELRETYSKKIKLRIPPPLYTPPKSIHTLRGMSSVNDIMSKSRSGSHSSSKTDYLGHSSYRSRSHTHVHIPPQNPYLSKSFSQKGSSSTSSSSHHGSMSLNSSSSKGKSGKSHSSSSFVNLRSNAPSKSGSSHKTTQGSYTLSIPSEDMGQNESVEDLLMSNTSHTYNSSKHTVHIIATSNSSKSKSSSTDHQDYDRHHVKYYSEVPEKRIKLDSHSRSSDHYHKSSSTSHSNSHDSYSKSKSKYSSSVLNGAVSSHSSSDSKSKSKTSIMSSSSSHSKSETSTSSKHHLRSTSSSTSVTTSKPIVSVSSLSSSSSHSRSHHHSSSISASTSSSDRDRDKDRSSSKKKKRKRDKNEPRKIIPLKDRDFNPDKHCGVCTPPSAVPCKRSLTCKTHSMALRRAVVGRSQSFDALLAAHKLAKTEEKKSQVKEVITPEVAPPKHKKKKPSGSSSTNVGSSPNDLGNLAGTVEPTSYGRSKSPDIEIITVKAKPKPPPVRPEVALGIVNTNPKRTEQCPLVYPYTPEIQSRFESVWNNPYTMLKKGMTTEEKNKFMFLLRHYKNPYYVQVDVKPKNPREKRNVFSNWNPSEKPIDDSQHTVSLALTSETKRVSTESDDDIEFLYCFDKK